MNLNPFYKNPADAAMPYYEEIPGTVSPYYQPYIDSGTDALGELISQYSKLLNNPTSVINMIGSSYTQSPGYQYQYNTGINAANESAAAGGMAGTPSSQEQAAKIAENLAYQDYNDYLNHGLDLYKTGLSGESGLNEMGYKASTSLADILANNLSQEGNLAYAGTQNSNAANGAMVQLLASALTGGISGFMSPALLASGTVLGPGSNTPWSDPGYV